MLELNRRIFIWLNICPVSHSEVSNYSFPKKCLSVTIASTIVIVECLSLVASSMYIDRNLELETDIENCMYAIFQLAALFSVIYMWTVGFFLRNTIAGIFEQFQKIYNKSNSQVNEPVLGNNLGFSFRWWSKFAFVYGKSRSKSTPFYHFICKIYYRWIYLCVGDYGNSEYYF